MNQPMLAGAVGGSWLLEKFKFVLRWTCRIDLRNQQTTQTRNLRNPFAPIHPLPSPWGRRPPASWPRPLWPWIWLVSYGWLVPFSFSFL